MRTKAKHASKTVAPLSHIIKLAKCVVCVAGTNKFSVVVRLKHGLDHIFHIELTCIKIHLCTYFIPSVLLSHELLIHITGKENHTKGMPCTMIFLSRKIL